MSAASAPRKRSGIYDRIIRAGLGSVLVFAALAKGGVQSWSISVIEAGVAGLVLVWFWRMNNVTGWRFRRTGLDLPVWIFIALASISCISSIYLRDSLFAAGRLLMITAVYYLVVNNYSERARGRLLILFVACGTGLSLFGLMQYFLGLPHGWWAHARFLSSAYVNHNHFAGCLELAIPLAIGLFFSRRDIQWRTALGAAVVIMSAAFIFTMSRGAWLCLSIASLAVAFYLSRKGLISGALFGVILFSLLLVLVLVVAGEGDIAGRLYTMLNADGEPSFMYRAMIWRGALDIIRLNPVTGTGIGTFVWAFPPHRLPGLDNKIVYAHNDYLHMAAEMGVLALALMAWMGALIVKKGFSLAGSPVYAGVTAGLLSVFLHGLVDFNFHIPANMMAVAALCAVLSSGNPDKGRSAREINF